MKGNYEQVNCVYWQRLDKVFLSACGDILYAIMLFHKMANLPPTLACERLGLSRIAPFIPIHDALDERVGTLHNFLCLLPLLSQSFEMCCWHQMHNKHTFTRLNIKCTDINQACQKLLAINHNLFLTLFYTVPQLFGNLSCTSIYLSKFMFLYTDMYFKAPKCKELPTRCQRRHWDGGLATSGRSSAVWQWLKYIYIYKKKGFSDTLVVAVLKQLYTQEPATFDSSDWLLWSNLYAVP